MPDNEKNERIEFLLRVWMRLDKSHWPTVKQWVEDQLNDELPERP